MVTVRPRSIPTAVESPSGGPSIDRVSTDAGVSAAKQKASEGTASEGTAKADRTRRLIFLAALEVAENRDLEAIRFASIASAAGVSRATVYNYFDSPEALFEALALEFRRDILAFLDQLEAEISDPLLRIAAGLIGVFRRTEEEPRWGTFAARWRAPSASMATQVHVMRWVREAAQDKRTSFDETLCAEVAFMMRGVPNFAMMSHEDPMTGVESRGKLTVLLFRSIGVDAAIAKQIVLQAETLPGMGPKFFV